MRFVNHQKGMRAFLVLPVVLFSLLLCSCSTYTSALHPSADARGIQRIYVETNQKDNHQIEVLLVAALRQKGLDVRSGPPTLQPEDVDAVLRYDDAWNWDFREHLVALNLELVDVAKGKRMGVASFSGPAALNKETNEIVSRLVTELLSPKKPTPR